MSDTRIAGGIKRISKMLEDRNARIDELEISLAVAVNERDLLQMTARNWAMVAAEWEKRYADACRQLDSVTGNLEETTARLDATEALLRKVLKHAIMVEGGYLGDGLICEMARAIEKKPAPEPCKHVTSWPVDGNGSPV